MERTLPREVDVLVIGNGPSALILSFILHGNIPVYDLDSPHPDPILHEKLKHTRDLLNLDIDFLTEHFPASRFSYSSQALPVNVLLDTLLRPFGETEDEKTCIKWKYDLSRRVKHLVVGDAPSAGGQWVNNPVQASWDIGTLSYARMLSLPGYSFDEHFKATYGHPLPFASRPTRRQVASYLSAYPAKVGIAQAIVCGNHLSGVRRDTGGFYISSHDLKCKLLVLASGIFNNLIPPRPLLQPLRSLPEFPSMPTDLPMLIIGSGFSAADVIISTPACQRIIHIFKWDPGNHPSPLRGCHQQAYPEYAGVYRRMKFSALSSSNSRDRRPRTYRRSSTFDLSRDWDSNYEGMPNTEIIGVDVEGASAAVSLRNSEGDVFERRISGLAYVVGRRGNLDVLSPDLLHELGVQQNQNQLISGQTFRQVAQENLEIAKNVFIIGSLTGDSLIRFSYGSCASVAGQVSSQVHPEAGSGHASVTDHTVSAVKASIKSSHLPPMNGFAGHAPPRSNESAISGPEKAGHLEAQRTELFRLRT